MKSALYMQFPWLAYPQGKAILHVKPSRPQKSPFKYTSLAGKANNWSSNL
jgi:hypothetical protein